MSLKTKCLILFSRSRHTSFRFNLDERRVLSFVSLAISKSGGNWDMSHRNTFNSNNPSMEPCCTWKIISDHKQ